MPCKSGTETAESSESGDNVQGVFVYFAAHLQPSPYLMEKTSNTKVVGIWVNL